MHLVSAPATTPNRGAPEPIVSYVHAMSRRAWMAFAAVSVIWGGDQAIRNDMAIH
jgi:hypothetical protein